MVPPECSIADQEEVLAAVESLYADELKPYGRILRKRLAERAQAFGCALAVDIDIRVLRAICESCAWLFVQAEDGGDWSALLRCRPATFVDVYSPQDVYPSDLWEAAAAYFGSLDDADMVLPGGRYSCAQVLAARRLPFLASRSLGQVCHIVQLAISQKKLLGYLNGAVVPYCRSQSMVKERCAERGRPCTTAGRGASSLAGWDAVRACLQDIIAGLAAGTDCVPLSNLKRLFRSRFHLELSETALGYAKLSELLQDPRLSDICAVRLQGHGYVVVPLQQQAAPAVHRSPISIADSLPQMGAPPKGLNGALLSASMAAAADESAASLRRGRPRIELTLEDISTPQASPTGPHAAAAPAATATLQSPGSAALLQGGPAQATVFPTTPSPCSARAKSLPKLLGSGLNRLLAWQMEEVCVNKGAGGVGASKAPGPVAVPPPCSAFSAAAARLAAANGAAPPSAGSAAADFLCLANHLTVSPPPPPSWPPGPFSGLPIPVGDQPAPAQPAWSDHRPLTPSTLGNMGFVVQNTFLQFNLPPPTPANAGASHRAQSLPRNMGSDRAEDAAAPAASQPR